MSTMYVGSCNTCSWSGNPYNVPEPADYERQEHENNQSGHSGFVHSEEVKHEESEMFSGESEG